MKQLLLLLSLPVMFQPLRAQVFVAEGDPTGDQIIPLDKQEKDSVIDHALLECIYSHTNIDEEIGQTMDEYDILQLGGAAVKYMSYSRFRVDSALAYINRTQLTVRQATKLHNKYGGGSLVGRIIWDLHTGEVEVRQFCDGASWLYREPRPEFEWTLSEDTLVVCGYVCQRATCRFRGREWEVWYTEEIPVSQGPWKFCGLPGLVLKAVDKNHSHIFEAVSIRKGNSDIKKNWSGWELKTTREKLHALEKDYRMNMAAHLEAMGVQSVDGTPMKLPNRRGFYNPEELE